MGPAQLIAPPKSNSPEEHTTCNKRLTNIIGKLTPPRPILDLTDEVALKDAKQQLQILGHNHFLDNLNEINTPWTNEIYTDGSLENGRGGYAVIFKTKETYLNDIQPYIQGAYDGPSNSSTLMELLAVYHAILLCPKNADVTIYTDSRNVIHTWRKLKDMTKKYETGKRQKLTNSLLWMNIRRLLEQREGITNLQWVKGHSGNLLNTLADQLAKDAKNNYQFTWNIFNLHDDEHKFRLTIEGIPCLQNAYATIKHIHGYTERKKWKQVTTSKHPDVALVGIIKPYLK